MKKYSPELGASFQLHYFAIHSSLIQSLKQQKNVYKKLSKLRANANHPWQANFLLQHPSLKKHLDSQDVIYLGALGQTVMATSSVRTVWLPQSNLFLKLSIDVRITSFIRNNPMDEMERAIDASKIIINHKINEQYPDLMILPELEAKTVKIPELESSFGILYRAGLTPEVLENTRMLGGLVEENENYEIPLLSIIQQAAPNQIYNRKTRKTSLLSGGNKAHMQNSLMEFKNGYPHRLILRDMEGISIVPEMIEDDSSISEDSTVWFSQKDAWTFLKYYLVINHIAHLISAIARVTVIEESELWQAHALRSRKEILAPKSRIGFDLKENQKYAPELSEDDLSTSAKQVTKLDEKQIELFKKWFIWQYCNRFSKSRTGPIRLKPPLRLWSTLRGRNALILVDGVPMNLTRDTSRGLSAIDPESIANIEVIRGSNAIYGGVLSGVAIFINISQAALTLFDYALDFGYQRLVARTMQVVDRVAPEPSQGDLYDADAYSLPDVVVVIRNASTGFNLGSSFLEPVKVDNYELGWKGNFNNFLFSLAVFHSTSGPWRCATNPLLLEDLMQHTPVKEVWELAIISQTISLTCKRSKLKKVIINRFNSSQSCRCCGWCSTSGCSCCRSTSCKTPRGAVETSPWLACSTLLQAREEHHLLNGFWCGGRGMRIVERVDTLLDQFKQRSAMQKCGSVMIPFTWNASYKNLAMSKFKFLVMVMVMQFIYMTVTVHYNVAIKSTRRSTCTKPTRASSS
uniref:Uncharacterized protein n=1 Tax=Ditylenchus dipsaci TaxID=166011 RepID=A0A915DY88_9BILA